MMIMMTIMTIAMIFIPNPFYPWLCNAHCALHKKGVKFLIKTNAKVWMYFTSYIGICEDAFSGNEDKNDDPILKSQLVYVGTQESHGELTNCQTPNCQYSTYYIYNLRNLFLQKNISCTLHIYRL